jgi:hypothetical protein
VILLVRVNLRNEFVRTQNWSTLDLYQYDRTRVEFGLSREF